MSDAPDYSLKLASDLMNCAAIAGWEIADLEVLAKNPDLFWKFQMVLKEKANLRPRVRFPVWKKIGFGCIMSLATLKQAFASRNCRFSEWASEMNGELERELIEISVRPRDLDLVLVSEDDLGLRYDSSRLSLIDQMDRICERASLFDLSPCHPAVGPYLRLQYLDQPKEECVKIASWPIHVRIPRWYYVGCSQTGTLWLDCDPAGHECVWDTKGRWVFVQN